MTRRALGWRRHEANWALRDVSLTVPPGGALGVIGGNGSGKTTLLQVMAGLIRPSEGEVRVEGTVSSLVDLAAGFHRDLTGRENLLIGGVLLGLSRDAVRERFDEIVAFSGLPAESLDWPLSAYSTGMGLQFLLSGISTAERLATEDVSVHVLEGYGHLDVLVGTRAVEDVFEPTYRWIESRASCSVMQ